MLFSNALLALAIGLLVGPSSVVAQLDFSEAHNLSSIAGTWSTGSQAVVTGPGFAKPANMSFIYPKNTGESYSFTDDGFYEVARYRFIGNGSSPNCITGVILWTHGRYTFNSPNNSIVLTPFGDGYQQVQDSCAAVSNFVENYNQTETFTQWRIFMDPVAGPKLHLFRFDGSPVAPQFRVSKTPNMLPQRSLRNVTASVATASAITQQKREESAGARRTDGSLIALVIAGLITCTAGALSLL